MECFLGEGQPAAEELSEPVDFVRQQPVPKVEVTQAVLAATTVY